MRRVLSVILAVCSCFSNGAEAFAQQVEQLGDRTWALLSEDPRSSNSVVFGGDEYTLLVDPGRTPSEALARIDLAEALTGRGAQKVVLTSADPSGALGVLLLETRDFEVSCHGETRLYLAEHAAELLRAQRESAATPEEAAVFDGRRFRLPDRSLDSTQRFHLGGHRLRSTHLRAARTRGDFALFSASDAVIAAGAVVFHGQFPVITEQADLRGWVQAIGSLATSERARFVAARGPVLDSEALTESRLYLEALLDGAVERADAFAEWEAAPAAGCSSFEANREEAARYLDRVRVVSGPGALGLHSPVVHREEQGSSEASQALSQSVLSCGPSPEGISLRLDLENSELVVLDSETGTEKKRFATVAKPVSVDMTTDGRLAFVSGGDSGRVNCFDLFNLIPLEDSMVGAGAGVGLFLADDSEYLLPIASKSSLAFVNTVTREIAELLFRGIAPRPKGLVLTPNERFAVVWYEESGQLSLVSLAEKRVVANEELSEVPIERVTVSEVGGELRLSVLERDRASYTDYAMPTSWLRAPKQTPVSTQVAVMGMIHTGHLESELWGLDEVAETIRNFKPDAVLVELPPDRWRKAWEDFAIRGVIEEPRVRAFAEYRELMFDLAVELGFEIVPCAAWTEPMNNLRRERLREFDEAEEWAEARAELTRISDQVEAKWKDSPVHADDPAVIHSDEYDRYVRETMDPVGRIQNDLVGPGGWYNINRAHMRLVHRAIDARPGQRLLVTFGAFHKYMFLDELRQREEVELIDLAPYLPKK